MQGNCLAPPAAWRCFIIFILFYIILCLISVHISFSIVFAWMVPAKCTAGEWFNINSVARCRVVNYPVSYNEHKTFPSSFSRPFGKLISSLGHTFVYVPFPWKICVWEDIPRSLWMPWYIPTHMGLCFHTLHHLLIVFFWICFSGSLFFLSYDTWN